MVNKEEARELYKQGWSYIRIARYFKVSKQRIHQIIKNYKNHGRQGRLKKYATFGKCDNCKNKPAEILHHKDFNNENDKISNLQPLCSSCHSVIHWTRKNRGIIGFINKYK